MSFFTNIPNHPFAPGVIDTARSTRRTRLRRWAWRVYHTAAIISMALVGLALLQSAQIMKLAEAKQEAICVRAEARHAR